MMKSNKQPTTAVSAKDAALIVALDEYQQLLDQLAVSAKQLQSAHFDLAQARMAVGPRLSPISYDYRMRANTHVKSDESEAGFVLASGSPPAPPLGGEEGNEAAGNDDGGSTSASTAKDPLFWFGALPNPRLRSAQVGFVNALESLVAAASTKARLSSAALFSTSTTEHGS